MARIVIVQGSLSTHSKTAVVVAETERILRTRNADFETLDLRSLDLQFCDGRAIQDYNADMRGAYRLMESADGFIFGMPVYCWSVSGVVKNLIDITAGAMENKAAGLLCNAGGTKSFLASSDLVKILSFESGVLTVHPIVYSCSDDFEDGQLTEPKVLLKIETMVDALLKILTT
ncbi:MAG: NADPH-dependent FMN reductase [Nitrospinaceae bacterium]